MTGQYEQQKTNVLPDVAAPPLVSHDAQFTCVRRRANVNGGGERRTGRVKVVTLAIEDNVRTKVSSAVSHHHSASSLWTRTHATHTFILLHETETKTQCGHRAVHTRKRSNGKRTSFGVLFYFIFLVDFIRRSCCININCTQLITRVRARPTANKKITEPLALIQCQKNIRKRPPQTWGSVMKNKGRVGSTNAVNRHPITYCVPSLRQAAVPPPTVRVAHNITSSKIGSVSTGQAFELHLS